MSPLTDILIQRIRAEGPISVADYMQECLLHPEHGYYTTRAPFGVEGDFITAPEISQMFGELVGLSLAQAWLDQGAPSPFVLAELGPGRGTLMADILRATRGVSGFHAAMQLCLVEASPVLRAEQAKTLEGFAPTWAESLQALPDAPLFLIANEFFDALPIRQFERAKAGWSERRVGAGDTLQFGLTEPAVVHALGHRMEDTRVGDVVEISAAAQGFAQEIGTHIEAHGGAAFIIDYGDWRALGDTLQALRAHAPADPLKHAGEADLTAHVDFEAIALASGSAHSRLTSQGVFLERLGITARAQALAANLEGEALSSHIAAHRRLTHPEEMGNLFKVMALFPKGATPPAGLES